MNNKTLSLTIAAGTMIAGSAMADYAGLDYDAINNGDGTWTAMIYATFTAETDELDAVFGDADNFLSISASSSFHQHALGSYGAPMAALLPLYPSLAMDSYVTIGRTSDADNNMMHIGINWDDFEDNGGAIWTDNGSWFATPDDNQVHDPGDGRILIGQFTSDSFFATGTVSLQGKNADGSNWSAYSVSWIPAPGALALLGLAGLASRRRRN